MRERHSVSITSTLKGKPVSLPFEHIKNEILGLKYILSLVFIGDKRSRTLNKKYRKKDTPCNILSFPLSEKEGEIFINPKQAARDAPRFNTTGEHFIGHLLIHGLLHLKGFSHGSKMNHKEQLMRRKFDL